MVDKDDIAARLITILSKDQAAVDLDEGNVIVGERVVRDRKTKARRKTGKGTIQYLFFTFDGNTGMRQFYVGGDRPKPKLVAEVLNEQGVGLGGGIGSEQSTINNLGSKKFFVNLSYQDRVSNNLTFETISSSGAVTRYQESMTPSEGYNRKARGYWGSTLFLPRRSRFWNSTRPGAYAVAFGYGFFYIGTEYNRIVDSFGIIHQGRSRYLNGSQILFTDHLLKSKELSATDERFFYIFMQESDENSQYLMLPDVQTQTFSDGGYPNGTGLYPVSFSVESLLRVNKNKTQALGIYATGSNVVLPPLPTSVLAPYSKIWYRSGGQTFRTELSATTVMDNYYNLMKSGFATIKADDIYQTIETNEARRAAVTIYKPDGTVKKTKNIKIYPPGPTNYPIVPVDAAYYEPGG